MIDLPYEKKIRLKYNMHSISSSFKKLENAVSKLNDQEIYTAIGELLLWVVTTDDWHRKNGEYDYKKRMEKDKNGVILLGMRHAFNSLKHNMSIFQIHDKEGGLEFPITFPLEISETSVIWMTAGETLNGKYPEQKENYIKYLEGIDIIETFKDALRFLGNEFQSIMFE